MDESCFEKPQLYVYQFISLVSNFPVDKKYGSYPNEYVGYVPFSVDSYDESDNIKVSIDLFDVVIKPAFADVEKLSKTDISLKKVNHTSYDFVLTKSVTGPQAFIVGLNVKSFQFNSLRKVTKQVVFFQVSENEF